MRYGFLMESMEALGKKMNAVHQGSSHLLREVMRTHQAMLVGLSCVIGMPPTRLGILRNVAVAGERGAGVVEVARAMGLDAAAITRQVASMEKGGLLLRSGDPLDKRRVRLRLSAKGAELFETVHDQVHVYEKRLLSGVSEADVATALRVLESIRMASLSEMADAR